MRWLALLTLAGCGGTSAGLNVVFDVDPGVVGASYSVWSEPFHLIGTRSAGARFSGLGPSTLWLQSGAQVGTGELQRIRLSTSDVTAQLSARSPQPDSARSVSTTAASGSSTSLVSTDAGGVTYRLLVLGFGFSSSTTITLTPLATPLLPFANGNGLQIGLSTAPAGTLFLEASGGDPHSLLVVWDPMLQDWTPIPGSLDADGVRTYPINREGVYSEVLGTPVAGEMPWGVDQYEAFELLEGRAALTLDWILANHADGSELTDSEQSLLDHAAAEMEALANAVVDHACTEGADWGELKLSLASLKVASQLGASPDYSTRLDDALKRCLGQILQSSDCSAALASGDLVRVEAQRQLLGHGASIATALGDAGYAQEIHDDIVNCTPGDPCAPVGGLPAIGPTAPGAGGDAAVVNQCGSQCASICANNHVTWLCDDAAMIAAEYQRCMDGLAAVNSFNLGFYACAVAFWVVPSGAGDCELWCEYKGFADHQDETCYRL